MNYDLILENNASKEFFLFSGLTDSGTNLYHQFEVDLDLADGEYTYVLLLNNRDDVEYEFKYPILQSIVTADGKSFELKDLRPEIGLMRIGAEIADASIYDEKTNNNNFIYYDE